MIAGILSFIYSFWRTMMDVFRYWRDRARPTFFSPRPINTWWNILNTATDYEKWAEAGQNLDIILGLDMWRKNPESRDYDYRLINERVRLIRTMRQRGDVYGLINALRTGLVRNLGNITSRKLFNGSFVGTKLLIEEYIAQYVEGILDLAALPPPIEGEEASLPQEWEDGEISAQNGGVEEDGDESNTGTADLRDRPCAGGMATATISTQHKLDFIHNAKQGFGRSALVLQGGAIFGLCHLGVVKALFLRGLLPRVIIGTATGAMMAALVGVHPEEDLLRILTGDGIDLSAFAGKGTDPDSHNRQVGQSMWTRLDTLRRRVQRFRKEGYFLDVKVLEECVRANVGDLTFDEAFNRSKRILNITVVTAGQEGIPTLLNYVTAPNVIVWTAAVASNASSTTFYGQQTKILCKDAHGNITPWAPTDTDDFRHWTSAPYSGRNAPLQRVRGLFNVNHYIVSQARPYLMPFLQSDMHGPAAAAGGRHNSLATARAWLTRMLGLETRHRLRQLDALSLLPASIRRFLVDEQVPGASLTLVPGVGWRDFARLLETPTRETLEYWMARGERSVWPAVAALRVRCAIEVELDRAYQDVRRLKAGDLRRNASGVRRRAAGGGAGGASGASGASGGAGGKGVGKERAWSTGARGPEI